MLQSICNSTDFLNRRCKEAHTHRWIGRQSLGRKGFLGRWRTCAGSDLRSLRTCDFKASTGNLICQLKTAALETDRLRDRVEQLEQLVGVDRSLTSRLRTAFGLEPGVAQVMGMLLKRDFVTHDALYVVLYAARWRRRHR